jgi:hypothetical protein
MRGVLGLDLAKTTGCAWIGESPVPRPWESWRIEIGGGHATRADDFFSFQKQLDQALRDWKPELVVYEEVTFIGKGKAAFRLNAILCGIVMVRCEAFAIPSVGVDVATLKKYSRAGLEEKGNGHPDPATMREFARRKLFDPGHVAGPFPKQLGPDETVAFWAAWYGLERVGLQEAA